MYDMDSLMPSLFLPTLYLRTTRETSKFSIKITRVVFPPLYKMCVSWRQKWKNDTVSSFFSFGLCAFQFNTFNKYAKKVNPLISLLGGRGFAQPIFSWHVRASPLCSPCLLIYSYWSQISIARSVFCSPGAEHGPYALLLWPLRMTLK